MATLTLLVDFTIPTAADFMANYDAINDEVRPVTTGGTGLSSYTTGDIPYASAVTTLSKLAVGTRGQTLTVNATPLPSWALLAPPGYYSRPAGSRTNATTVNVTADVLAVVNASGQWVALSAVNVSPAITASGANGLDTGAEAANTWYFVWVIWNATTAAGLLSVSATLGALTLPSGYTFARLVGAVRNDGGSNFRDYRQVGAEIWYPGDSTDGPPIVFTGLDGETTPLATSIASFVPPERVVRVAGIMGGDQAGATSGMAVAQAPGAVASMEYASLALGDSAGSTVMMGWAGAWPFEIPWTSDGGLAFITFRTPATTAAAYRLGIRRFDLDL